MGLSQISPGKFRANRNPEAESRKAVRFCLEAAASCSWVDSAGRRRECKGWTRDVSHRGAYIIAPENPPRGVSVRTVISLPPLPGETRPLRIEAEGLILRVDRLRQGMVGFAIANQRLILCNL
ncbi:MAG TPA: hypothetical protein VMU43_03205 [Candidatus Acidoferrum sp.]|nr:hypothetical protein [Candidatus Acidoferrum sp.]